MNNRDSQVICDSFGGYAFPATSRYDDDSWDSDTMLLAWAPWFSSSALAQKDIVPQYAVDVWLPGGIPIGITEKWAWRNQFSCFEADLYIGSGRSLEGV